MARVAPEVPFLAMLLPPPRHTLFPYTTLFRSWDDPTLPLPRSSSDRSRLRMHQAFMSPQSSPAATAAPRPAAPAQSDPDSMGGHATSAIGQFGSVTRTLSG